MRYLWAILRAIQEAKQQDPWGAYEGKYLVGAFPTKRAAVTWVAEDSDAIRVRRIRH